MQSNRVGILSNVFKYAGSQYIAQFFGFFTAIFMRRYLGPENMGVWTFLMVIISYATFTHLGTTSTVFYQIPYYRGKGDLEEAENIKNVVFSYIALMSFIAGIGIALYAFLYRSSLAQNMFIGLIVSAVLLLLKRVYTYYVMLLRANKNFSVLSRSVVFDAVVNLGMVLVLVRNFKLTGLFISVLIMPLLNILFIRRYVNYNIRYKFDLKKLKSYIAFGFPLFITGMLVIILQSVDKIMIAKFIGLEGLGFYSIAVMTRNYSEGLSKNFNVVISPHFFESYGKAENMDTAGRYLKVPAEIMSHFMALLLGLAYIISPYFIGLFLPQFMPGIIALRFMLLTTYFYTASPQSHHFLIAMKKRKQLIPIISFVIFVNIVFNFILIKSGFGISGVAAATAISAFAAFLISLFYSMRHMANNYESVRFILKVLMPGAYGISVLLIMDRLSFTVNTLADILIKCFLYCLLFIPFLYILNKKTGLFSLIKECIKGKIRKGSVKKND